MNKKGQHIFSVLLVVVVLIALFTLVVIVSSKLEFNEGIGKSQFRVLDAAQKADNALLYLDKSVDISKVHALNKTTANGGFSDSSECGEFHGYKLWTCKGSNKMKETFPDPKENFISVFSKKLDSLLSMQRVFPRDNYHMYFKNGKLKGNALVPIVLRGRDFRDAEGISPKEVKVNYNWDSGGKALGDYASNFAGTYNLPYVWGGVSPYTYETTLEQKEKGNPVFKDVYVPEKIPSGKENSGQMIAPGFDCSGFVWWSMRHIALDVERLSAEGYYSWAKKNGKQVCDNFDKNECSWEKIKNKAKEGDLLFINPCDDGKVCHIGIYAGDGEIAESAGGSGVVTRDIPENYKPGNSEEIAAVYRPEFEEIDKFEKDNGEKSTAETESKEFVYDEASTGDELIYSVYPSFVEDLDLQIYDELRQASLALIEDVNKCNGELKECINKNLQSLNEMERWEWSTSCGSKVSQFRYSLSDELYRCLGGEDSNCYCKVQMPEGDYGLGKDFIIERQISEEMVIPKKVTGVEMDGLNKALRKNKVKKSTFERDEVEEIFSNLRCLQKVPDRKDTKYSLYMFEGQLNDKPVIIVYNERVANLNVLVEDIDDDVYYTFYELPSTKLSAMFIESGMQDEPLREDKIKNKCIEKDKCLEKPLKEYMESALDSCPVKNNEGTLKIAETGKKIQFKEPVSDYVLESEYKGQKADKTRINMDETWLHYDDQIYILKKNGESGLVKEQELNSIKQNKDLQECDYKRLEKARFCVKTNEKIPSFTDGAGVKNLKFRFSLYFWS